MELDIMKQVKEYTLKLAGEEVKNQMRDILKNLDGEGFSKAEFLSTIIDGCCELQDEENFDEYDDEYDDEEEDDELPQSKEEERDDRVYNEQVKNQELQNRIDELTVANDKLHIEIMTMTNENNERKLKQHSKNTELYRENQDLQMQVNQVNRLREAYFNGTKRDKEESNKLIDKLHFEIKDLQVEIMNKDVGKLNQIKRVNEAYNNGSMGIDKYLFIMRSI